ncbi:glycosyltransferase 87 family protein [Sinomonas notoginsengisoli]|uniref:glycosyltransferase family 87 protein n=1 Tax=Sinomonas notoginsengisoli TaxID=1457311 RepID=UPI001F3120A6|nr:glycosyltransferase 87 family protein [Sinomonas notoginsengisoli]
MVLRPDEKPDARQAVISPTRNDPFLHTMSEIVGGPLGDHAAPGLIRSGFWTPERVLVLFTAAAAILGVVIKGYCRVNGWITPQHFYAACYSDIPALFKERGFADGILPFFSQNAPFEYPVLTSLIAGLTALMVPGSGVTEARATAYFDVNAALLSVMWLVAVIATARSNRRRPWDAAMLATAPGAILAGFVNWDLWSVALLALAIYLFSRNQPFWAGVFIGLGVATKLYPLLVLGAILLLAVRTGRYRQLGLTLAGAGSTWLAVNLPFMLLDAPGWAYFFDFTRDRPAGFSSIYYAWNLIAARLQWVALETPAVNAIAAVMFGLACLGIAIVALHAPRRPRLAQLAFLLVAALILTDKVYSPQYVVWLIPLLALARPRWRDFLIWMLIETLHWWAVWMYLGATTSGGPPTNNIDSPYYVGAVLAHIGGVIYLCVRVLMDIYDPAGDPIRRSRQDDPQGGEFDRAPDAVTWDSLRHRIIGE